MAVWVAGMPSEVELKEGLVVIGCRCPEAISSVTTWELKRFKRIDRIGDGMASRVYSALDLASGMDVALKAYNLTEVSSVVLQTIISEISIHSGLDHPHIAQLWASFRDGDFLCVIMPLATNGDLYSRFKEIKHDEHSVAKYVLMPVLSALGYMHREGILHRDIKLENILLDKQGHTQVADFGFALRQSRKRALTQLGTLQSMAPEIILGDMDDPKGPTRSHVPRERRKSYGGSVDVWALGVMLWELITGTVPFNGHNESDVINNVLTGHSNRPEFLALSSEAQDFLGLCLKWYPDERATILELYSHPLILRHVDPVEWRRLHPEGPTSEVTSEFRGTSGVSHYSFVGQNAPQGAAVNISLDRSRGRGANFSVAGSQYGGRQSRAGSVGLSPPTVGGNSFVERMNKRKGGRKGGYASDGATVSPLAKGRGEGSASDADSATGPAGNKLSKKEHRKSSRDAVQNLPPVNEKRGSNDGAKAKKGGCFGMCFR